MRIISVVVAGLLAVPVYGMDVSLNSLGGESGVVLELAPGQTFALEVGLNADVRIRAIDLKLESVSNTFDLLGRVSWEPWVAQGMMVTPVDSQSVRLGWGFSSPESFAGTMIVGTVQLSVTQNALPGLYTISPSDIRGYFGSFFPAYVSGAAGSSQLVLVTPEPGTLWLATIGAVGLLRRRR